MLPANPNPQDMLLKFANWCVVVTTILTVPVIWPLTSLGNNMDLDLIGIFKLFVIPVNSGWVPLSLAILWSGTSALGIIAGRYIIHISYKGCQKNCYRVVWLGSKILNQIIYFRVITLDKTDNLDIHMWDPAPATVTRALNSLYLCMGVRIQI